MSLSFIHDELKEVKTHKREFLEKMDAILPWEQLYKLVKPCYYEGVRGNKPYDLELMLRIHLILKEPVRPFGRRNQKRNH